MFNWLKNRMVLAEVDGIKFYSQRSLDLYLARRAREDLVKRGLLHTLRYSGYANVVPKLLFCLQDWLDRNKGKVLQVLQYSEEPYSGRLVVEYSCEKKFPIDPFEI